MPDFRFWAVPQKRCHEAAHADGAALDRTQYRRRIVQLHFIVGDGVNEGAVGQVQPWRSQVAVVVHVQDNGWLDSAGRPP